MVTALLLSAWLLHREFGVFIPVATWLRASGAGAAGFVIARVLPHDSILLAIAALGGGFAGALATLVVTRELGQNDWRTLRRIIRRD
jgi:hypothetical protein